MPPVKTYRIRKAIPNSKCTEVTIPYDWVERNGLKVGDTVFVFEGDSFLLITPSIEVLSKFAGRCGD